MLDLSSFPPLKQSTSRVCFNTEIDIRPFTFCWLDKSRHRELKETDSPTDRLLPKHYAIWPHPFNTCLFLTHLSQYSSHASTKLWILGQKKVRKLHLQNMDFFLVKAAISCSFHKGCFSATQTGVSLTNYLTLYRDARYCQQFPFKSKSEWCQGLYSDWLRKTNKTWIAQYKVYYFLLCANLLHICV